MSQFYANIQGSRGEATRQGGKATGISGHIRGWEVGCQVYISYDKKTDKDVVKVYKTSGSNGSKPSELIAEYTN